MTVKRTRTALLACLAAAVAGGCQHPQAADQDTPQETLATDDAAAMPEDPRKPLNDLRERQFQGAIEGLDFETGLVVVTEPPAEQGRERAIAHHVEGLELLQSNRRTGALTSFAKAVRADPAFAAAYIDLGRSLVAKGKTEYALAAFRTALSLDPDSVEAGYETAITLGRLGRTREAVDQMLRVVDLAPRNAKAHERLAIWYYYAGDDDDAWRHVDAARELGLEPPGQFIALLEARSPATRRPAAAD